MFIKKINYTDYNGVERSEDFYFHFSKAELLDLEMKTPGGLKRKLETLVQKLDTASLVDFFRKLILDSYGEKSADGIRFNKSKAISDSFCQTEAFSNFYVSLCTNAEAASEFINALFPEKVLNEISEELEKHEEANERFYEETMAKVTSSEKEKVAALPKVLE